MTATNTVGSVAVETEALAVTYPAPVAVEGVLADVGFDQGSGMQTVAAAPAFAGEALRFAVEGAGATIDPATGAILIPTDTLRAADAVTVTASNSGGTATASFHVTVAPAFVLPLLVAAPALAGTGVIGSEVTLDPGVWVGYPAPSLGFAWCRDGAEISGAIGAAYTPGPEDDGSALTCRVTATNSAGSAAAETAALAIAYAPPVATGELPDEVFDEDSGLQEIPTASAFAGEALRFAVEGRGATIDAATGVVSIDTAEPLSGETVTVTAGNSGGTATASFLVTVEVSDPAAGFMVAADEWTAVPDPSRGTGHRTITVDAAVAVPAGHQLKIWTWSSPGTATAKTATITPGVAYQSNTALKEGEPATTRSGSTARATASSRGQRGREDLPHRGAGGRPARRSAGRGNDRRHRLHRGGGQEPDPVLDQLGPDRPEDARHHRLDHRHARPERTGLADAPDHGSSAGHLLGGQPARPDLHGQDHRRRQPVGLAEHPALPVPCRWDRPERDQHLQDSTDVTVERCYLKGKRRRQRLPDAGNLMDTAKHHSAAHQGLLHHQLGHIGHDLLPWRWPHRPQDRRLRLRAFRSRQPEVCQLSTRLQFINNWFGRAQRGTSAGAHDDCFQFQNGGLDGCLFRGNIHWKTTSLWTGGVTGANQGFYIGSTTAAMDTKNTVFEQNIMMQDKAASRSAGCRADIDWTFHRNNLMYSIYGWPRRLCFIRPCGYKEKNVIVSTRSGGADNGGLHINTISGNPELYASDTHFVNGGPRNAAILRRQADPEGHQRDALGHANKIGPWERLREIADHAYRATLPNPVIPGDVGWPVAPAWQKRWNDNGGVVTSYTSKLYETARTSNVREPLPPPGGNVRFQETGAGEIGMIETAARSKLPDGPNPAPAPLHRGNNFWRIEVLRLTRLWRLLPRIAAARCAPCFSRRCIGRPGLMLVASTTGHDHLLPCGSEVPCVFTNIPFEIVHIKPPTTGSRLVLSTQAR